MEQDDLSKLKVTDHGIIQDVTDGAPVLCPTCNGYKTIPDPQYNGRMLMYCGPNGERCPHITCLTCSGSGWVFKKL